MKIAARLFSTKSLKRRGEKRRGAHFSSSGTCGRTFVPLDRRCRIGSRDSRVMRPRFESRLSDVSERQLRLRQGYPGECCPPWPPRGKSSRTGVLPSISARECAERDGESLYCPLHHLECRVFSWRLLLDAKFLWRAPFIVHHGANRTAHRPIINEATLRES